MKIVLKDDEKIILKDEVKRLRIKHLKVNGFGKLKDKELDLKSGINVIYGENEAGKSTLLKFISAMFYGASKNKNGKNIADFDKFKPWKTEEYSGTVDYNLDNGEEFTVYREFKRKNPTIYNSRKEDITKNFKEDKSGIDFFAEQTGIDEEIYYNTAISEQAGVELPLSKQNSLVQRISNLVSTGDDNISYQKLINQISKLQNENVGTDRTSLKPLNIVNNKIESANKKIKEFEQIKDSSKNNDLEAEKLKFRLKSFESKLEFLKEVKKIYEDNRIKLAEINFNKNSVSEDDEKIQEIVDKLDDLEDNGKEKIKINKAPYIAIAIVLVIVAITLFAIFKISLLSLTSLIPMALACIVVALMLAKINNLKNSDAKELLSKKSKLKFELDTLKEKKRNKESEIKEKNKKIELEMDSEKDNLVNEYLKTLDINFIDDILAKPYEDILEQIEEFSKKISDIRLDMKELEVTEKAYNKQIEEISKIQEELNYALEEKEELLSLNNSYNIAKECLEKAYEETKNNISPKFTNNLCETISKISNDAYKKVVLNDNEGISVELENGEYVPLDRLSLGTIDQMYLSLRLSAIKEISNESMPIILDEAFAYFDNERLENIIEYLKANYEENQILIFTCSNREKDVLDKLNIEYNFINLEK